MKSALYLLIFGSIAAYIASALIAYRLLLSSIEGGNDLVTLIIQYLLAATFAFPTGLLVFPASLLGIVQGYSTVDEAFFLVPVLLLLVGICQFLVSLVVKALRVLGLLSS